MDLALLGVAAALNLAQVLPRSAFWVRVLRPVAALSHGRVARHHVVGLAVSNLVNARVGDVARVALLRGDGVPVGAAAAATALEKAVGALALAGLSLPLLLTARDLPAWIPRGVFALAAFGATSLLVAAFAPAALRWAPWLARFSETLAPLRSPRAVAPLLALAAMDWALCGLAVFVGARAAGLHLGWSAAPLTLLAVNAAVALPSTPAGVGVYELAAATALRLAGAGAEEALAAAVALHAAEVVPATLGGLALGARQALRRDDTRAEGLS